MRQALELAAGPAAHWFRDGLRHGAGWSVETAAPSRSFSITMQDLKDFFVTYCLCFVGAIVFIS